MTDQTRTPLPAQLDAVDGKGRLQIEDVYDTDVEDLWSALTEPDRLRRWLAEVSGQLQLGGRVQATFTSGWEGPGRIDVCDRPHRLKLTMNPGGADETVLEAVLTAAGEQTRLAISEAGLPLAELPNYGAGWQAHVEDLAAYLAGRDTADWHTRWMELIPSYRAANPVS